MLEIFGAEILYRREKGGKECGLNHFFIEPTERRTKKIFATTYFALSRLERAHVHQPELSNGAGRLLLQKLRERRYVYHNDIRI